MGVGRGYGGKVIFSLAEALELARDVEPITPSLANELRKEVDIQGNVEAPHQWIELQVWGCSGRFEGDQGD